MPIEESVDCHRWAGASSGDGSESGRHRVGFGVDDHRGEGIWVDGFDPVWLALLVRKVTKVERDDGFGLDVDSERQHMPVVLDDRHRADERPGRLVERAGQGPVHPLDAVFDCGRVKIVASCEVPANLVEDRLGPVQTNEPMNGKREEKIGQLDRVQDIGIDDGDAPRSHGQSYMPSSSA